VCISGSSQVDLALIISSNQRCVTTSFIYDIKNNGLVPCNPCTKGLVSTRNIALSTAVDLVWPSMT
jgi:hypothetical protein